MTAHHRPTEAQIDPARAFAIRSTCALISATLDPGTARTTLAAGQLLAQIELAYPGSVQSYDNQTVTLHLFTVRASATSSTIALLRAWQCAALRKLEEGGPVMDHAYELGTDAEFLAAIKALVALAQDKAKNGPWELSSFAIAWTRTNGTEVHAACIITGDTDQDALDQMADAIAAREEFDCPSEDISHLMRKQ